MTVGGKKNSIDISYFLEETCVFEMCRNEKFMIFFYEDVEDISYLVYVFLHTFQADFEGSSSCI